MPHSLTIVITYIIISGAPQNTFILQDACVRCHLTGENYGRENSVVEWKKSVHFRLDSGCADCHGGSRFVYLSFKQGHMGLPKESEQTEMCGKCHAEAKDYFTNRPKNEGGKSGCTVTCVGCHGYHNVQQPGPGLVNEQNCGHCHSFDRAKSLRKTYERAWETFEADEKRIASYDEESFPTQSYKARLEEIRKEIAKAFHSQPVVKIDGALKGSTMKSFADLESEMDKRSPRKWKIEGFIVVLFFIAVVVAAWRYQATITSGK